MLAAATNVAAIARNLGERAYAQAARQAYDTTDTSQEARPPIQCRPEHYHDSLERTAHRYLSGDDAGQALYGCYNFFRLGR